MRELIVKDAKKLLVPYVKYSAIGFAIYLILIFLSGDFTISSCVIFPLRTLWKAGIIPVNGPLWFLLTLSLVRVLANAIAPPP